MITISIPKIVPVMRLSRSITKCGVSMHPSHAQCAPLAGYDEKEMISAVTVPQLFMPCKNDPGKFSKVFLPFWLEKLTKN